MAEKTIDPINPPHYRGDTVMRIIEEFNLGFKLGNVVKYILRHDQKAGLEDLRKSLWYLQREIAMREKEELAKRDRNLENPHQGTDYPD